LSFKRLSDKSLVWLYRKTTDEIKREKIFHNLLFRTDGSESWSQKIKNYVFYNSDYGYDFRVYDHNDIYQEVIIGFAKAVNKQFKFDEGTIFATYAWEVIKSTHLGFMLNGRIKRKTVEVDGVSKIAEVDSNKIVQENIGYEYHFEYIISSKNLIISFKNRLKPTKIEASNYLIQEIMKTIDGGSIIKSKLSRLSKKHKVKKKELLTIIELVRDNKEKKDYIDIINYMEYDIGRGSSKIIMDKLGVSKFMLKSKRTGLKNILKKHLKDSGLELVRYYGTVR